MNRLYTNKYFVFLGLATNWASGEDDHVVARAEYDFTAASEEEISLAAGDMLNLAPKGESSGVANRDEPCPLILHPFH